MPPIVSHLNVGKARGKEIGEVMNAEMVVSAKLIASMPADFVRSGSASRIASFRVATQAFHVVARRFVPCFIGFNNRPSVDRFALQEGREVVGGFVMTNHDKASVAVAGVQ